MTATLYSNAPTKVNGKIVVSPPAPRLGVPPGYTLTSAVNSSGQLTGIGIGTPPSTTPITVIPCGTPPNPGQVVPTTVATTPSATTDPGSSPSSLMLVAGIAVLAIAAIAFGGM